MFKNWLNNANNHADRLKIGLLLSLSYEEEPLKNYKSRITDIQDNVLAIELPIEEGTGWFKPFLAGTELLAVFTEREGIAYRFPTKVIKIAKENIPLLHVTIPEGNEFQKIQRRDYMRVPANLQVKIKLKDDEAGPMLAEEEQLFPHFFQPASRKTMKFRALYSFLPIK